jgi:hypothetical protein
MREIKLTQGKVTLVDDEDYDLLCLFNWYAQRDNKTFYAVRRLPRVNGKQKTEYMHRIVLARKLERAIKPGMMPDHEDGNGLNNQRYNLSEVTNRGNQENQHIAKTSTYTGVCWHKVTSKWVTQIQVKTKTIYLGIYTTELEAALAREGYINAHPELNAKSNFPPNL